MNRAIPKMNSNKAAFVVAREQLGPAARNAPFQDHPNRLEAHGVGKELTKLDSTTWVGRIRGRWRCLMGNHEPLRNKVRRQGTVYHANCQRCGVAITKRNGRQWQVASSDS